MTFDEMFGTGGLDKAIAAFTFADDVPSVIEGYGDPRNNWPPGNLEWCVLNVTWTNAFQILYCRPDVIYFSDGLCFAAGDPRAPADSELGLQTINYLSKSKLMDFGIDQGLKEIRFDCPNQFADVLKSFWDVESVGDSVTHFVAPLEGGWDSKAGSYTLWARGGFKAEDTPQWLT